jgi:hypothetical protein
MELWNGNTNSNPKKKNGKNNVKVSQPISGQQILNTAAPSTMYSDGTSISSLPTNEVTYGNENSVQPQQLPNYNAMYRQDTTPLVGAATPGGQESFSSGPAAANEFLGGSGSFGSAW